MSIELADAEFELAARKLELQAARTEMRLLAARESRLKIIVEAWRTITETAAVAATRRDQSESNEEKPDVICEVGLECQSGVTSTGTPFVTLMEGDVQMSPELARHYARAIIEAADESVEMAMASRGSVKP